MHPGKHKNGKRTTYTNNMLNKGTTFTESLSMSKRKFEINKSKNMVRLMLITNNIRGRIVTN